MTSDDSCDNTLTLMGIDSHCHWAQGNNNKSIDNENNSNNNNSIYSCTAFVEAAKPTAVNAVTTTTVPAAKTLLPLTTVSTTSSTIVSTTSSSSAGTLAAMHTSAGTLCHSPEPPKDQDLGQDAAIWQVLADLDRYVKEARKDHILLAAEIEDLMTRLVDHCCQLGLDPANVTHLLVFPITTPITLTTRRTLHRACDDLYQDILRRKVRIERWVSRIITIAENICEPPERYLKTDMPSMSRARVLQLERTYRTLEKEWMERMQRFQSMVGMLRVRWDQCAYFPIDNYDHALSKLFELAELHDETMEFSFVRIEAPLCLSQECLASLSTKLANLDQSYYTRQARIRAMEHILSLIYQDLRIPEEKRVVFRNEATVKYAAELGRELKGLQLELNARKLYLSGECWEVLTIVWDACLISDQERQAFKAQVDQDGTTFIEKVKTIQSEIEKCRTRFSKSKAVYKLMMIRSNHIKRMISFEQTASDPKRLFQPSFRLVDEEKFRRRAYPTLLKLEESLIAAIKQFETENGEQFMYDGVPYIETLQSEVSKRHVNKTVFAKFTPKIVAPTKGQAIQIMGRSFSPIPVPTTPTQVSRPQKTSKSSLTSTHLVSSPSGPSLKTNKSKISPPQPSSMPDSLSTLSIHESQLLDPVKNKNKEQKLKLGLSDDFSSLKSYLLSHQRGISDVSTESLGSNDSVEAKSSAFSLSMTPASVSSSASNSPTTETTANNSSGSYFGSPISSTTTSPASSVSAVVSLLSTSPPAPTSLTKQQQVARLQRLEQLALPKNKLNAVAKRPQANNTAKRVAA